MLKLIFTEINKCFHESLLKMVTIFGYLNWLYFIYFIVYLFKKKQKEILHTICKKYQKIFISHVSDTRPLSGICLGVLFGTLLHVFVIFITF